MIRGQQLNSLNNILPSDTFSHISLPGEETLSPENQQVRTNPDDAVSQIVMTENKPSVNEVYEKNEIYQLGDAKRKKSVFHKLVAIKHVPLHRIIIIIAFVIVLALAMRTYISKLFSFSFSSPSNPNTKSNHPEAKIISSSAPLVSDTINSEESNEQKLFQDVNEAQEFTENTSATNSSSSSITNQTEASESLTGGNTIAISSSPLIAYMSNLSREFSKLTTSKEFYYAFENEYNSIEKSFNGLMDDLAKSAKSQSSESLDEKAIESINECQKVLNSINTRTSKTFIPVSSIEITQSHQNLNSNLMQSQIENVYTAYLNKLKQNSKCQDVHLKPLASLLAIKTMYERV